MKWTTSVAGVVIVALALSESSGLPLAERQLAAFPERISLKGGDDGRQLVITGQAEGRAIDLTSDVKINLTKPGVAKVLPGGRVVPVGNGSTELVIEQAGKTIKVPVEVKAVGENLPINFPNQIVPIFTKLGCNAGGCHGKASGQNGFRLSLLGFEPELDYQTLVKESRGRRLFPAAPDESLLLKKAAGVMPHGGGKKLQPDGDEYRLLRRWIAAGMPWGGVQDPTVKAVEVYPPQRLLARGSHQQLAVLAHYSDGSVEDVTRRAQYESNATDIATVEAGGLVGVSKLSSGEAGVMVRYQGHVTVFRATVPLGVKIPEYSFPIQTLVDTYTLNKFKQLGLVPAELSSDAVFARRVYVDLIGTLPTPGEVASFGNDKDPAKRSKLIDRLVERPEYGFTFGNKWADILKVKRNGDPKRAPGTEAFHDWLVQAMADDLPYDQFVRAVIAATGDETVHPPVVWYKEERDFSALVDDTAQVFLGQRLACANCHHHPFEKWSQDDYWGMAAFYGRVGRKNIVTPGAPNMQGDELRLYVKRDGSVTNKRTSKPAVIKALDAPTLTVAAGADPRTNLVDWMTDPKNPFVAKAIANRYWAHFFGRGIVDPLDDMRVTNPPCNPELLDALAADFVKNGYGLKHLVKTIAKSRTYQLSAVPNEFNKTDKQNFSRFYPRRLPAEVLLDAVSQITDSPTAFGNLPTDLHGPRRALMLPDENHGSYFLEVFGKPARTSSCECERTNDANLAQALHLLNSDEVQQKLSRAGGRADKLASEKGRDDAAKVKELFYWAYGRQPTDDQLKKALEHLAKHEKNKKQAYENLLWALINTKEFLFVQ